MNGCYRLPWDHFQDLQPKASGARRKQNLSFTMSLEMPPNPCDLSPWAGTWQSLHGGPGDFCCAPVVRESLFQRLRAVDLFELFFFLF